MTTPPTSKVVLIGDTLVGKTSLLQRFAKNTFSDTASDTTQLDKIICPIAIDGNTVQLDIWDTAGQERYGGITTSYYRGTSWVIIVYDVTVEETFQDVGQWISDANECVQDVKMALVGNKCDCSQQRVVSSTSGKALADSKGMLFMETSAKTDVNVRQLFEMIGREIIRNRTPVAPVRLQGIKLERPQTQLQPNKRRFMCK